MYHYGNVAYEVAASEAAKKGRERMEQIIASGRASALQVVEQVERQVPVDHLVSTKAIQIVPNQNNDGFSLTAPGMDATRLHHHAMSQIASKADIPHKYINLLTSKGAWGRELAAENINRIFGHANGNRNLIRAVDAGQGPEVRGFLSDRFRRLDNRPLLDAFIGACKKLGAIPINGFALDTKVRIRAVLPQVFEPMPNEVMLFGIQWGNSDFGDGGHCLSLWNMRVWCSNTAVMDEVLRQVHLGRVISEDITYSKQTLELDTKANASAMADVVGEFLGPKRVNGYLECVRKAVEEKVDERDVLRLLKGKLDKGETERVNDIFKSPDVVNLPPGNTMYRLSNAVSWFAQDDTISRDRQLSLQRVAGELMPQLIDGSVREI